MKTANIREELHHYIEAADDKKVKAIYKIIGSDIVIGREVEYDDEFFKEIEKRDAEMRDGSVKTFTWEEVRDRAREAGKKLRNKQ